MKRFFLGMVVGFLAVSALWSDSRARPLYWPVQVAEPPAPHPAPVLVVQHDPNQGFPPVRDGRESVSDIPVPIVPGTRVTEAQAQPPRPRDMVKNRRALPPSPRHPSARPRPANVPNHVRVIKGRRSADEQRATNDVRTQVDKAVGEWLGPEVPTSWQPPAHLREALVQNTEVHPVEQQIDGGTVTMYEAWQTVDFSPARRSALVEAYQRELVTHRLTVLAGVLAFILACLAALAGYIRADEATKGYYTNRLRLVSAAGVGAAGVLIYQLLV